MNAKNLLTFQGIVALLYGLSFVFVTNKAIEPYMTQEGQITPSVIHMAQLFGALLIAFGVGCLIQRGQTNHKHWMYMIIIANGINVVLNTSSTTSGLLSSFNWGSVVLVVILVLWAAYVLVTQKSHHE